jgi:two-component system response regulator AtoC
VLVAKTRWPPASILAFTMMELDFTTFPVLVVDDEQDNLDAFRFVFRKSFALTYARGGEEALGLLDGLDPAVVVADQRMPGMSGIELLGQLQRRSPDAVGVLLTAYTDLPLLLEAINSGAVHRYVQKPWDSKELTVVLRQGIERFHTLRENRRLKERLARYAGYLESQHRDPLDFGNFSTESAVMRDAILRVETLAAASSPVLIAGEAGTEKELFASALHVGSARERNPFIVVSCPPLAGDGLERDLFGWKQDAFDGAMADRPGRLELAHGGTLVLAELGEVTPSLETQLRRFLADGLVRRIGARTETHTDVRIVATTTDDPAHWLAASALKRELGWAHVVVPPLRQRLPDLPGMSRRLLSRSASRYARPARAFDGEAMARLVAYPWPGNVAELSGVIERAVLLCPVDTIGASHLALEGHRDQAAEVPAEVKPFLDLPGQLDELERRELCTALERCGGNKAEVARMLGIQRTTLYYRLKRLGIEA